MYNVNADSQQSTTNLWTIARTASTCGADLGAATAAAERDKRALDEYAKSAKYLQKVVFSLKPRRIVEFKTQGTVGTWEFPDKEQYMY